MADDQASGDLGSADGDDLDALAGSMTGGGGADLADTDTLAAFRSDDADDDFLINDEAGAAGEFFTTAFEGEGASDGVTTYDPVIAESGLPDDGATVGDAGGYDPIIAEGGAPVGDFGWDGGSDCGLFSIADYLATSDYQPVAPWRFDWFVTLA